MGQSKLLVSTRRIVFLTYMSLLQGYLLVRSKSSLQSAGPISGLCTRSTGSIRRSLSFSCILAAQESTDCSCSTTGFFQIASIASHSSVSNALNSCCSASPSARCALDNCRRWGSSFLTSPAGGQHRGLGARDNPQWDVPLVTVHLATSFEIDLRRYSSSSTVPLRPDPTLRSNFLFVLELCLSMERSWTSLTS